jgi:polar amino acid transport system permease protein/cystine transport system permease protein
MGAGEWGRAYALLPQFLSFLFAGAVMTVIVTVGSFVVSVILGLIFAGFRTGKRPVLRMLGYAYVEVFRAVPVLTQLFIIYFGLAAIGIRLSPIPAAITGFGLNGGAYLTEVFRSGIEAVGRGQVEAAHALGLSRFRTLILIVFPQGLRVVLPSLVNFSIGLLKDTSLASAVAAPELSFNAHMLVDRTFLSTQVYLLVAFFYLAMSLPLAILGRRLERRLSAGRHR